MFRGASRRSRLSAVIALLTQFAAGAAAPAAEDDLRERLTEREDQRRPVEPWRVDIAGRPLTLGGEYELAFTRVRPQAIGDDAGSPDRLLLEQGLEVEAFYSVGPALSMFVQLRAGMEEDLLGDTIDEVSERFVERGEMWFYSERIAGSNLSLDLGRLHFEDDRRWWWDEDLDAVRVAYALDSFELAFAAASELGPSRSDLALVAPEDDGVRRLIAVSEWDWRPQHTLQLFLLHQTDHSPTDGPGQVVESGREDLSDARLTWLGARLIGGFALREMGILGYWFDSAYVTGSERVTELDALSGQRSAAVSLIDRDVRGWAVDAGLNWIMPLAFEPRLVVGYALGSGDPTPEAGSDRAFRQSGLQANEAGFGGVERFPHYGVQLDPELSNLQVLTLGAGCSLLAASSLDLVYHGYRQVEPAPFLREARLETTLTGAERDVGEALDAVLALEEWERLEFELIISAFRAGRAFGAAEGTWSYGGFFALRVAF